MWLKSGRWFPLVCVFESWSNHKGMRVILESGCWNRLFYSIWDLFRLMLYFCSISHSSQHFTVLEGVWVILGTVKIFAKRNGGRFVEILDSSPWSAPHCCHVIIGIKPCHQKLLLLISPQESVWGGGRIRFTHCNFLIAGLSCMIWNVDHAGISLGHQPYQFMNNDQWKNYFWLS